MQKTKVLLNMKKLLLTIGLSTCLTTTVTGCGEKEMTTVEYLNGNDNNDYNFFEEGTDMKLIKIKDFNENESYHLARIISLNNIYYTAQDNIEIIDYEDYKKYEALAPFDVDKDEVFFYIDIFDDSLLSVKYDSINENMFKDDEEKVAYAITDIVSEDDVYNCVIANIGPKDSYTQKELEDMLTLLNNQKAKQISK